MRARGLSGEGGRAFDDGRSPCVGTAPHAASKAVASSATAVLSQIRVNAKYFRRAATISLSGLVPCTS